MPFSRFLPCYLLLAALAGCQSGAEKSAPAADAAPPPSPEEVTLTPTQLRAAEVTTGTFTWLDVSTPVEAQGMIDVPPQNLVSISAMLGGYVQKVNVLPGQRLRKGEVVAVLRDPAYVKLQQDYLQARARATFLQQELARQQTLVAEDAGARRKLEQATADYQSERAAERGLAAQLRLLGLPLPGVQAGSLATDVALRSPINGYVTEVSANPGQYVAPQTVLVQIVDRSDLHLMIKVFARDAPRVRIGQRVRFALPGHEGPARTGQIILLGHAYHDADRTIELHAHLDEANHDLLPGQYVNCHIETSTARQRTLPEEALIQAGDVSYVYAQTEQTAAGHTFRRFRVRTGATAGGHVAVTPLDPLPDTTRLVLNGTYFLDGERVKGQEEEE